MSGRIYPGKERATRRAAGKEVAARGGRRGGETGDPPSPGLPPNERPIDFEDNLRAQNRQLNAGAQSWTGWHLLADYWGVERIFVGNPEGMCAASALERAQRTRVCTRLTCVAPCFVAAAATVGAMPSLPAS